ncbi:MAG TPA: ROK family transcriptional regulator, partial [Pyrinomonadaceae bacterium]|nr:ROK family transcriptional regulator [Pyrinomonadaceae bacterium]
MASESLYHFSDDASAAPVGKASQMLRLIRAAQPISRVNIASRLGIDPSTVSENVKPLVASGILSEEIVANEPERRRTRVLSFNGRSPNFAGVNLGVRRSQVGLTTLRGEITDEIDFETPSDPYKALSLAREHLDAITRRDPDREVGAIGVSVPGMTDGARQKLLFAPHLDWRDLDIARAFRINDHAAVVVENDSTAAALYEARLKIRDSEDGLLTNFILVRSGTGIGVGLVIGGRIHRGNGIAGEFGHMTIVAGGKPCVCGNRGCWERYASAAAAASLYLGDRPPARGEMVPRFVDIVAKANVGDTRSTRTLEKIGDYLGIGIANVIMGIGIPRVIISGRL